MKIAHSTFMHGVCISCDNINCDRESDSKVMLNDSTYYLCEKHRLEIGKTVSRLIGQGHEDGDIIDWANAGFPME